MAEFASYLHIRRGLTALIGSGGKTTLMLRLARELRAYGSVIVTTSTHIFPPEGMPVLPETQKLADHALCCVAAPAENGKLCAPQQPFEALAALADFVLVEADGSARRPLKAHLPHEPVIPAAAGEVICLVGATGIGKPVFEAAHRPERFVALGGDTVATPEAITRVLRAEALFSKVLINQADAAPEEAEQLARLLGCPAVSVQKGEILCEY